jgi:alpha-glucosidase
MQTSPAGARWWQGATLYQVYVRSFRDTDGDGYGDLRGVIAGLDYLAWLGVDGIWLSPTMPSPDQDWGYDVSGYRDVHPELGTLADLDELIAEAGSRGIRVLLDLVPNHTSNAHPWFAEARSGRDSPRRNWYVWADPAPGGGPPSNWRDPTGAPAWTLDEPSGQYYLHNFLPGQPDLNWWEPAVREEFRRILRFWFDRGVAGVRIDVAHGLYKDAQLRDNPPLGDASPQDGRYGLRSVYNFNQPEVHGVYRDWRRIADGYQPPRLLLGETWVADLERMAGFYGHGDELQLALNIPFLFADFTAAALAATVAATLARLPAGACPVWAASNHDVGRFPSRWCGGDEARARLALLVLATLPGTLLLYYGDEIAMTDTAVPPELQRDRRPGPGSGGAPSRDRGRTPMPWDASPGAGFTTGPTAPWLPVGGHAVRNVASQREDTGSVLWLCRRLLALRRAEPGGQVASYQQLPAPPGVWCYRAGGLVVTANFSDERVALAGPAGQVLLATGEGEPAPGTLGPWQGTVSRPAP